MAEANDNLVISSFTADNDGAADASTVWLFKDGRRKSLMSLTSFSIAIVEDSMRWSEELRSLQLSNSRNRKVDAN